MKNGGAATRVILWLGGVSLAAVVAIAPNRVQAGTLPTSTPTLGSNDCCQCSLPACGVPSGGGCSAGCTGVYGARCNGGSGQCATITPVPLVSNTPTLTPTLTPTETPTSSPTETPTRTPTGSPTETASLTPTKSPTSTPTDTPSITPTRTPTETPTKSPSGSPTQTPTQTPTPSPTSTPTPFRCCQQLTPIPACINLTIGGCPSGTDLVLNAVCVANQICGSPTPTFTPTSTPTRTPTASPSVTPTATLCSNGVLDRGEQCDDHNLADGDLCPSDCKYTIDKQAIRGNKRSPAHDKSGCQIEWYVAKNPAMDKDHFGLPNEQQACNDGDAACDFSGGVDGMCLFKVVACVNNSKSGLGACQAKGLSSLLILGPRPDQASSQAVRDALAADLTTLQTALMRFEDPQNPAAGYTHTPPIADGLENLCTQPFNMIVPLAGSSRRVVKIKTRSANAVLPVARRNLSTLKLLCRAPH
ncbi:MAG: hypothetical protein HY270_10155 [Deltaproteobacteria bacterium]|nr:hypothetical protein [Deltaproteobacteria bacterium]